MTRYLNFCSACALTVVIFGHLIVLFAYLLTSTIAVYFGVVAPSVRRRSRPIGRIHQKTPKLRTLVSRPSVRLSVCPSVRPCRDIH